MPANIFQRPIKMGDGVILRPMSFYVGLNKIGRTSLAALITSYGGAVASQPGDQSSHIIALTDPLSKASIGSRTAYSVDFVTKSVEQGKLLDLEEFRIVPPQGPGTKKAGARSLVEGEGEEKGETQQEPSTERQIAENTRQGAGPKIVDEALTTEVESPDVEDKQRMQNADRTVNESVVVGSFVPDVQISPPATNVQSKIGVEERSVDKREGFEAVTQTGGEDLPERPWKKDEDEALCELYREAKVVYVQKNDDPALARTLACWVRLAHNNFLPAGRSAEECHERILALRAASSTRRKSGDRRAGRRTRTTKGQSVSETDTLFFEVPSGSSASPMKTRRPGRKLANQAVSSATSDELKPRKDRTFKSKPEPANKTQRKIFKLVECLAERGGVSERHAFKALRNVRGDWRRALKTVMRQRKSNAP